MFNDKLYNILSNLVYHVDETVSNRQLLFEGQTILNGKYQLLKIEDNQINGMQAMAVSPIINNTTNTSKIIIAYAGTNPNDEKDLLTDIQMIGSGDTQKLNGIRKNKGVIESAKAQSLTALEFADTVEQTYPNASIITTGHSLGQSLAMYVALKKGFFNIGYNGPDIHKMLTDKEITYMQQHPHQFKNYRNIYDGIGNVTGNKTNTAIYVDYGAGFYTHALEDWRYNEEGYVIDNHGNLAKYQVITQNTEPTLSSHSPYLFTHEKITMNNDTILKTVNQLKTYLTQKTTENKKLSSE